MDKCVRCWWYPDECFGTRLLTPCVRWEPDGLDPDFMPSEEREKPPNGLDPLRVIDG